MKRGRINIEKDFIGEISLKWQSGDVVVIASRPGIGKTSLCQSFIQYMAKEIPVALISITTENTPKNDLNSLQSTELTIVQRHNQNTNIHDLKQAISDIVNAKNVSTIIIDNVELINEKLHITTSTLKRLSRELSIVIIMTIALDKKCKHEQTAPSLIAVKRKVPLISQFADYIILIDRPEYYVLHATECSLAFITLAKAKIGGTGYFPACFNKKTFLFEDFDASKILQ